MKKSATLLTFIALCCFTSCGTATPETYFTTAVLSCNMMHGFANAGLQRELESPSVKMVDGNVNKTEPMKRKEIIDMKIGYLEPAFEKVKDLKQTDDNKEMVQASLALYEYVLPVYKNEYQQLARLYDDGAPKEQIASFEQSLSEKYYPTFEELHNKLTAAGKPYAAKHNINVQWDISTSPR